MSSGRRTAAAVRKAEAKIVTMPEAFARSIAQLQQAIMLKIATVKEARDDIPETWVYDLRRGGFVPPPEKGVPND